MPRHGARVVREREVAELLNRDFVPIKVDREERPDVDDIYMPAVQTMTGSGGWPLSLFLTPDGKPFYGGTYFPPDDRYGRPGFPSVLAAIADAWKNRREELEASARELLEHLDRAAQAATAGPEVGAAPLEKAARSLAAEFDPRHGGFGGAPKFPPAMRLEFLIRRWLRTGEPRAREMVETTLAQMAAGGMYDQVGGGFHRYSVDARWLVPHFEKMLYDNALLARAYLLAFRAFGDADFARVARETLDYLLREMTPEGGGFFAAQDADSGGEEGTFYVWDPASLEAAVGPEGRADRRGPLRRHAGRGTSRTDRPSSRSSAASPSSRRSFGWPEPRDRGRSSRRRGEKMYEARSRRVWPGTDDKLLTDWTALAISAFALAGRAPRRAALRGRRPRRGRPHPAELPRATASSSTARRTASPGSRASPPTTPSSSRPSSTSTRRPSSRGTSARPCGSRRDGRALRGPARRLLPLGEVARRPDPPAAGALRRRDPVVQLGRGDEPAAALSFTGETAYRDGADRIFSSLAGLPRPRAGRVSAAAVRARLPRGPAAGSRAGRQRPAGRTSRRSRRRSSRARG